MTPHDLPYFVTFVACEIGVTQLIAWRRRTEDSLRKAHDELELRLRSEPRSWPDSGAHLGCTALRMGRAESVE